MTGLYNSPNQSTFCLNDVAPAAPSAVTAGTPSGTDAGKAGTQVAFVDSVTPTVASYNVYRAIATQPTITGQGVTCPTLVNAGVTTSPQTPPTAPYAVIGTVADITPSTSGGESYTFLDSTATVPPSATPTNPEYCYAVTSVDKTGQEGNPSTVAGPTAATAATPAATAPKFVSASNAHTTTVTVTYDQAINCASVDTNGSDYTVTFTRPGTATFTDNPIAAACTGTTSTTVTLTVPLAPAAGDTVLVTATNGTDGNTVTAGTGTSVLAQPVGDAVQTAAV